LTIRLSQSAGRPFSAGLLFVYPSIKALADHIVAELSAPSGEEKIADAFDEAILPELEGLSVEELNAILAEFADPPLMNGRAAGAGQ